jgi:D-alanyl-D-alanine carboxypeptidase
MRPSSWRLVAVFWLLAALIAVGTAHPAAAKYASLVIDAKTGKVLESLNADGRHYPASLTKMMTLYLTFEALNKGKLSKNQRLRVSAHAAGQPPSKLDLTPGETITVEQAILALTVKSANDVAVVLGEALGGTESHFAQLMTQKARELGMRATTFRNASGLPNSGQVTTARDMATLARALIRDYPQYYGYFSAREFTFQGNTIATHNHVLTEYEGADGLKTGYIHASGFNLVTSAVRDGRRLIGVVLGGQTSSRRDHAMMRLLDMGFAKDSRVREASYQAEDKSLPVAKPAARVQHSEPAEAPHATVTTALATTEEGATDEIHETSWAIQVGAFARAALAQRAAEKAQRKTPVLAKSTIAVGHARVGGSTIYRARIVGLSENQARIACVYLHRHKGSCLLVAPGGDRAIAQVAN